MFNEKISIIIPCYNQAQYLEECLDSVINQTYQNWECIIVNDGSPDNTDEVALDWCAKDSRFLYLKKDNGGVSSARNAGLEIAKGVYIQFLDSDDLLNKFKLEKQINCFNRLNDVIICDYFPFNDESGGFLRNRYLNPFPDLANYKNEIITKWEFELSFPTHCILFKSSIIKLNGDFRFDESLSNHEDWVFWVKLFYFSKNIFNLNESLVSYRIHNKSCCTDTEKMKKGFIMACEINIAFFNSLNNEPLKLLCEQKRNHLQGIRFYQPSYLKSFLVMFVPPILLLIKNKLSKK